MTRSKIDKLGLGLRAAEAFKEAGFDYAKGWRLFEEKTGAQVTRSTYHSYITDLQEKEPQLRQLREASELAREKAGATLANVPVALLEDLESLRAFVNRLVAHGEKQLGQLEESGVPLSTQDLGQFVPLLRELRGNVLALIRLIAPQRGASAIAITGAQAQVGLSREEIVSLIETGQLPKRLKEE